VAHLVQLYSIDGVTANKDQADALCTAHLIVQIPYPCFNPPSIQYASTTYNIMSDESYQGLVGVTQEHRETVLENIWQGVKNDPRWLQLSSTDRPWGSVVVPEGQNTYTFGAFNRLDFSFITIPDTIDYWWNSYDFCKLGLVMLGSDVKSMPAVFLNSRDCSIPCAPSREVTVVLAPGCSAVMTPVPPVEPPQLAWTSFAGSGLWPDPARLMFPYSP